jgi:hypothetical protein
MNEKEVRRPVRSVSSGERRRVPNPRQAEAGSVWPATLLVGAAVALIEPELLVGMGIGMGTMLLPKLVPELGNVFRPLFKSVVKAGYLAAGKMREIAAEAGEEVQDAIAEAQYEREQSYAERAEDMEDEEAEMSSRPLRKAQA